MFKVFVKYPSFQEEFEVARRTTATMRDEIRPVLDAVRILELQRLVREVPASDHVVRYALTLVRQTRRRTGRSCLRQRQGGLGAPGLERCNFSSSAEKLARYCMAEPMWR